MFRYEMRRFAKVVNIRKLYINNNIRPFSSDEFSVFGTEGRSRFLLIS